MGEIINKDNIESGETGEAGQRKSVWLVDDDASFANAFIMITQTFEDIKADFQHFQTGEEAVNQCQQIVQTKGKLPDVIMMDYRLDQWVREPKFHTGVEVIEELKRICSENKIPLPEIVSSSSDDESAKLLLAAGASSSMSKVNAIEFIERFKKSQ